MAKTQTLDFRTFVRNDYKRQVTETLAKTKPVKIVAIGAGLVAVLVPKSALAATQVASEPTWTKVFDAAMNIVDWLVVGVFIVAGVSWMFGHRSKALELLIGGAAGYILARHAIDIRDFLKTL
jgi:hypothetical protein